MKKGLLTFGTIVGGIAPVIAVVSCGNDMSDGDGTKIARNVESIFSNKFAAKELEVLDLERYSINIDDKNKYIEGIIENVKSSEENIQKAKEKFEGDKWVEKLTKIIADGFDTFIAKTDLSYHDFGIKSTKKVNEEKDGKTTEVTKIKNYDFLIISYKDIKSQQPLNFAVSISEKNYWETQIPGMTTDLLNGDLIDTLFTKIYGEKKTLTQTDNDKIVEIFSKS
ncbi:MAG: hypothetical protein HRT99_03780 [Mycoplasmatales bacterium]|nr:hypothetical protein [Mycoplasmatales bacterium]